MRGPLHPWMKAAHAAMLASGERLSCKQVVRKFGPPENATASKLMHAALKSGYFAVEYEEYEGWDGICTRAVFTAVPKDKPRPCRVFRVASVWQLADVM